MFAAVSFVLFMAADGAAPAKDVDTRPLELAQEIAQVLAQARQDFEVRYTELGLLGAAPLAGTERVTPPSDRIASTHPEFDGAAQAPAAPPDCARHARSH